MSLEYEQGLVEQAPHSPQAFEQLYDYYFPKLYAYVSYRVGRARDAEDLTAAVFLKVVEEIDRFEWRHDNAFAAWLFRIAHNSVSNFHRDHGTGDGSDRDPLVLDDLPDIPSDALLPADLVERQELFAYLHRLVAGLSPRRREVVSLRYFAGLQNREIALVLGLDERTVASHLSRALDDLQNRYEAGEREPNTNPTT
jgi:RNA polymerase sigma-70 factor (ECF subfamily)